MATDVVDKTLNDDDVPEIVREIFDVRNDSETLGRVLKLSKATVDSILLQYSKPKDRLFRVIDEFIKRDEPAPTWGAIVCALRDPLIGLPNLAKKIENEYCPVSPAEPISDAEVLPTTSVATIPNSASIPAVPHSLTERSCKYNLAEMKRNIRKMEKMFKELKKRVIRLLQEMSIRADDVVYELTELPASDVPEHESLFKEHLPELQKYKENRPLFSYLNCYWNYLSPQLLYHLVGELLSGTNAEDEMQSYDESLIEFRVRTLLKLFCETEQEHVEPPEGFSKIVAKFERDISKDPTLQNVEEFRLKFAKRHKLRNFALMLNTKVTFGSFIVTFLVPNSVVERLKKDVPNELFGEFDITIFEIAGTPVFCNAISQSSETTAVPHSSETPMVPHSSETTMAPHSSETPMVPHSSETPMVPHSPETTLVPHSTDTAVVPHSGTTTLSHSKVTTAVHHCMETSAVPHSMETAAVPHSMETSAAPHSMETTAVPYSKETTAVPHSKESTADPHSKETTAVPHSKETTVVPHSKETTAVPHSKETTVVPHSKETTAVPHSKETTAVTSSAPPSDGMLTTDSAQSDTIRAKTLATTASSTAPSVKPEIIQLKERFKELKKATQQCLEKCDISVERITNTLKSLSADNGNDEHKFFSDNHMSVFEQAHNHSALIGQLDFNMDYLSYHLLDYLVEEFGLEEVKVLMEAYKLDIQEFRAKTPVTLFCQSQPGKRVKISQEFKKTVAEFKQQKDMKLNVVEQFQKKYTAHYHLKDLALIFAGIRLKASVITVTWFFPRSLVTKLKANIPRVMLKIGSISKLRVSGTCVYRSGATQDYLFIEEPSEDYFCPVTTGLLLYPHLTSCCGKYLSLEAAIRIQRGGGVCPLCKSAEWSTVLNKELQRQVKSLRVFCRHEDRGCRWQGELRDFDKHVESCQMRDAPQMTELLQPTRFTSRVPHTASSSRSGYIGTSPSLPHTASSSRSGPSPQTSRLPHTASSSRSGYIGPFSRLPHTAPASHSDIPSALSSEPILGRILGPPFSGEINIPTLIPHRQLSKLMTSFTPKYKLKSCPGPVLPPTQMGLDYRSSPPATHPWPKRDTSLPSKDVALAANLQVQESSEKLGFTSTTHPSTSLNKLTVECQYKGRAPANMLRGSATNDDQFVYCALANSTSVYRYELSAGKFEELASCPYGNAGLAIISGELTAVGGMDGANRTNKLFTLRKEEWVTEYPPMNIARSMATVVATPNGDCLFVIGGSARYLVTSVELFCLKSRKWEILPDLPRSLSYQSATITGDLLHVVGDDNGYSCYYKPLITSETPVPSHPTLFWKLLPHLPVTDPMAATLCGEVVVIGGREHGLLQSSVYQLLDREWVKIGSMNSCRNKCLVANSSPEKLLIIGGMGAQDTLEECSVTESAIH